MGQDFLDKKYELSYRNNYSYIEYTECLQLLLRNMIQAVLNAQFIISYPTVCQRSLAHFI